MFHPLTRAIAGVLILLLLLLPLPAWGAGEERTVAVAAFHTMGLSAEEAEQLRVTFVTALQQRLGAERVRGDLAIAAAEEGCQDQVDCLAEQARARGAEQVLSVQIGRLGSTYLVRALVIDSTRALVARQDESTVVGQPPEQALRELVLRLYPPTAPAEPGTNWWLWTAAGVGITAAVTIPLVLWLRDDGGGPRPPVVQLP